MIYFRLKDQEQEEKHALRAINAEAKKNDPHRYTNRGAHKSPKRKGSGQVQQGF